MTPQVQYKASMQCPACGDRLFTADSKGAAVETCASCSGIWADFLDEAQFLQKVPTAFTIDDLHRLRKLYEPLGKMDPVKYLKCPVCGDLMYRRNWGGNSGVIVDRCQNHGTWYDAGEPEKIREYVALGGLEYEKLRHHETGLSDVGDKLRKEVSRLDGTILANRHLISRLWTAIICK